MPPAALRGPRGGSPWNPDIATRMAAYTTGSDQSFSMGLNNREQMSSSLPISALDSLRFRIGVDPIPHWVRSVSALDSLRFRTGFDSIPHWNSGDG
jgi:hypothetical protein